MSLVFIAKITFLNILEPLHFSDLIKGISFQLFMAFSPTGAKYREWELQAVLFFFVSWWGGMPVKLGQ